MRIAVGCDHAGFPLKETVIQTIEDLGCEVLDVGTYSLERVDFPDFAEKVGLAIQEGRADRGIAICGSGVGSCIAANKMNGIYASVCHDTYSAHQGVEHDNMNVLCLGARIIGVEIAKEIVEAFVKAKYFNSGNYAIRVEKIKAIERKAKGEST